MPATIKLGTLLKSIFQEKKRDWRDRQQPDEPQPIQKRRLAIEDELVLTVAQRDQAGSRLS